MPIQTQRILSFRSVPARPTMRANLDRPQFNSRASCDEYRRRDRRSCTTSGRVLGSQLRRLHHLRPNVRNEGAPEREALREPNGDAVARCARLPLGKHPRITE